MPSSIIDYYLYYSLAVNAFRVLVYSILSKTINQSKVKVDLDENVAVKEVTQLFTNTIRLFMTFRGAICLWGTYLPDSEVKRALGSVIFGFDLFIYWTLLQPTRKGAMTQSRKERLPAIIIQSSIVLAGIIYHYSWLFLAL